MAQRKLGGDKGGISLVISNVQKWIKVNILNRKNKTSRIVVYFSCASSGERKTHIHIFQDEQVKQADNARIVEIIE